MDLDRKKIAAADAFLATLDRRIGEASLAERVQRVIDSAAIVDHKHCWDDDCDCDNEMEEKDDLFSPIWSPASDADVDVCNNPVDGIHVRIPRQGYHLNDVSPDGVEYVTLKDLGLDL